MPFQPPMQRALWLPPPGRGERRVGGPFSIRQAVAFGMKKRDLERLFCAVCCLPSAGEELGLSPTCRLPRFQLMAITIRLPGPQGTGGGDPLCPLAALGKEALASPH